VTRHELDQLRNIYNSLASATAQLGDMIIEALRDHAVEDTHHTALEDNSNHGAAHDKFRPL
jgi:hypothetical protein